MKRLGMLGLVVTGSLLTSSAALADIAPDPCEGKSEGDGCVTPSDEPGTCQAFDCGGAGGSDCGGGLDCVPGGGTGGAGGAQAGSGGNSPGGGSTTGEPTDTGNSTTEEGCSVKAAGSQRDASAAAVLVALGLGAWLSRRQRS